MLQFWLFRLTGALKTRFWSTLPHLVWYIRFTCKRGNSACMDLNVPQLVNILRSASTGNHASCGVYGERKGGRVEEMMSLLTWAGRRTTKVTIRLRLFNSMYHPALLEENYWSDMYSQINQLDTGLCRLTN